MADHMVSSLPPSLTSCGVDVDNLHERAEPPVLGQSSSDSGVGGGESVEEAEEPPQLDLHLLHRHVSRLPPLHHHWITEWEHTTSTLSIYNLSK